MQQGKCLTWKKKRNVQKKEKCSDGCVNVISLHFFIRGLGVFNISFRSHLCILYYRGFLMSHLDVVKHMLSMVLKSDFFSL